MIPGVGALERAAIEIRSFFAYDPLVKTTRDAAVSASDLRRQLSMLNVTRAEQHTHETTYSSVPSVIYSETETGAHGNFLAASYKRICADADWSRRLSKTYTASSRVPRSSDRRRGELECANSSDALLMNIFCFPRILHGASLCTLLGIESGLRPEFGVRANIPMQKDETDRTEIDMRLGPLLVEAKLTESNFGTATRQRMERYTQLEDVFDTEDLPWSGDKVNGYQLVRGVLAAKEADARFVLLCDGRRTDLQEMWFRVLRAVRSSEVRSRMALLTWQELAPCTPAVVKKFLREKYGIHNAA